MSPNMMRGDTLPKMTYAVPDWYILEMIGEQIDSISFCLSSSSSTSASWLLSNHSMASSTAFSMLFLSSSLILPATCIHKPPYQPAELTKSMQHRVVKYGSVYYTDTRIYACLYAVHTELGCSDSTREAYTAAVTQAGVSDLCS